MKDRFFIVAYSCKISTMDGLKQINGNATFDDGKFPEYREVMRFVELRYDTPIYDFTVLNIIELSESDYYRFNLNL